MKWVRYAEGSSLVVYAESDCGRAAYDPVEGEVRIDGVVVRSRDPMACVELSSADRDMVAVLVGEVAAARAVWDLEAIAAIGRTNRLKVDIKDMIVEALTR